MRGQWGQPSPRKRPAVEQATPGPEAHLEDRHANLTVASSYDPIALVLDASRTSQDQEAACQIEQTTSALLRHVPRDAQVGLYFLGSHNRYDPGRRDMDGESWWRQESGNISLLGPPVEAIQQHSDSERLRIVVLGAGPVYDLTDFVETDIAQRLVLASYGSTPLLPLQCPPSFRVLESPSAGGIAGILGTQGHGIIIDCVGFMPYHWDNPGYEFYEGETGVCLRSREHEPAAHLSLNVSFLCPQGEGDLSVAFSYSDGSRKTLRLESAPLADVPSWRDAARLLGTLTYRERETWTGICGGMRYICPHCGGTHAPTKLLCDTDPRQIVPVFRCLEGLEDGLVTFHTAAPERIEAYRVMEPMLRVAPDTVVAAGPPARVYRFNAGAKCWEGRDLVNCEPVGPLRVAALALPAQSREMENETHSPRL